MSIGLHKASAAIVVVLLFLAAPVQGQWAQWGGPHRDFKVECTLADSWPKDGPRQLWSRDLGAGYSAILLDGKMLYTMYRKGDEEAVIALDAATGKTKWEYAYKADPYKQTKLDFGKGPNGTPLISGSKLYTVGFTGIMHCLDKKNGKVKWSHDLVKEYGAKIHEFGYSCSPIAYKKTIIVPVGGNQTGLIAFDPEKGGAAWKTEPLDISYASPIAITIDGDDQIAFMSSVEVIGIAADSGKILWRHPHANHYKNNCFMPIWDAASSMLLVSSHTDAGSRGLHIHKDAGHWRIEEVWTDKKMRMFHGTGVVVGDHVYGSLGDEPPNFLAAVRMRDGKVLWKERGFPQCTLLYANGALIVLDEDGQLALARVSPEKCEIVNKVKLLDKVAWTVPTLVDGKLYVRDQKTIRALDVAAGS